MTARMATASPPDRTIVGDPAWLAHRYDPQQDAVHFVRADRALRRRVPFLTDDEMKPAGPPAVIARARALAAMGEPAPVHFILHSAFCCSTLLAKAFDIIGTASALSEPRILNDLVGWRHRGGDPAAIGEVLDGALRLLARPFEPGEAIIVKPSNLLNGLAAAMLTLRPQARVVLIYAPLRVFLASIARKGMWGRLWVRDLLAKQLTDGLVDLGFEPRDYLLHTDLQAAAVGWLTQHALFAKLAAAWPDRVRTLDSEMFVARPRDTVAAVAGLYGLAVDADAVARGEAFARNSKDGTPFAAGQRGAERSAGAALHAEEIEKVATWAEAVAANAKVAMTPPAPLLT